MICPRCIQGSVHELEIPLPDGSALVFLCDECDATWTAEAAIDQRSFDDFEQHYARRGGQGMPRYSPRRPASPRASEAAWDTQHAWGSVLAELERLVDVLRAGGAPDFAARCERCLADDSRPREGVLCAEYAVHAAIALGRVTGEHADAARRWLESLDRVRAATSVPSTGRAP